MIADFCFSAKASKSLTALKIFVCCALKSNRLSVSKPAPNRKPASSNRLLSSGSVKNCCLNFFSSSVEPANKTEAELSVPNNNLGLITSMVFCSNFGLINSNKIQHKLINLRKASTAESLVGFFLKKY